MSLVSLLINAGLINDADFLTPLNFMLDGNSCVVGVNDFVVAPGTGLQVTIASGYALVYSGSKTSYIPVYNSATINQAITSNSSGSTRIDLICIKVDTTITSDTAMDNVVSIQYVAGTPGAGIPSTPAGYYKLCELTVANGASSFTSGNIADKRKQIATLSGIRLTSPKVILGSDAQGDIYYNDANGNLARLPAGTAGKVLQTNGAGANPSWVTQQGGFASGFGVYLNGAQTPTHQTYAKVLFDTAEYDLGSEFDITTNHRFIATNTGTYLFGFTAASTSMGIDTNIRVAIYKNGSAIKQTVGDASHGGAIDLAPEVVATLSLAATDYVEFFIYMNDTADRAIQVGQPNTFAWGQRLY